MRLVDAPRMINVYRAVALAALRAVAVVLLAFGAFLALSKSLFGLFAGMQFFEAAFQIWSGTGDSHPMYRGLAMMIVGAALAIASRPISRWIITVPPDACPRCGHLRPPKSGQPASDRCPECGLAGFAPTDET